MRTGQDRTGQDSVRGMQHSRWVLVALGVLGVSCSSSTAVPDQDDASARAAAAIVVDDVAAAEPQPSGDGLTERSVNAPFPRSAGRSIVADLIERGANRAQSRPEAGLSGLDNGELAEYAAILRRAATERGEALAIRGDATRRPPSASQQAALSTLAHTAAGRLEVEWNDVRGTPSAITNLLFARRGFAPREVWEAFLDEHFAALAGVFHLEDRSELSLTGTSNLEQESVILHGSLLRQGLPVDGEFIEVIVSVEGSRMGGGVLQRIHGVIDARHAPFPAMERSQWLTEAQARSAADARRLADHSAREGDGILGHAMGATLRLDCGDVCTPYWRVSYRDGLVAVIEATHGTVLSMTQGQGHIGPLQIQGRPPGSGAPVSIRFRGANVVNASTGVSLGQTSPVDGTHSFTTSSTVHIGLQGPVGLGNPATQGRVERQYFDGFTWLPFPLRVNWTPSTQPAFNFGFPNQWAPNADPWRPQQHTTQLVYGWMTYWQNLFANHVYREETQRLAIVVGFNPSLTGIVCGNANSGNLSVADANGHWTWGTMSCDAPSNDDVNTAFLVNGDSIVSSAHEYGHTVQNCAAESGFGCANANPVNIPPGPGSRPPIGDWRIAIHGGATESIPNGISNILTRFEYLPFRDGVAFEPDWTYTSYDSPTDSFGTLTQDTPSQLSCPDDFTCPTSPVNYLCLATDHNYYRSAATGGLCARACGPSSPCPSGLFCQNQALRTGGMATVCMYNSYRNKFWDTISDRLAYTLNWREALAETLTATAGQSNNLTRDLVLGPDSYYLRYLYDINNRFEVTRAVRSVYSGPSFVPNDDFTDRYDHGAVVPVRSTTWTPLWWGNGLYDYPTFSDGNDMDVVMFRGIVGSAYRMEAWFKDTTGSPTITIRRLSAPATYWTSYSGTLTTAALPATDWYVASVWGGIGNARWEGRLRLESGSDDLSYDTAEALPVAHGFTAHASSTWVGDTDAFQIHTPVSGTSLELNVSGLSSGFIHVYSPSGSLYGTHNIASTNTTVTIASLPAAGHWTWKVVAGVVGSYTTNAWLGCGFGSPGCDTSPGTRATRQPWGDNFAGRLPTPETEHVYTVSLAEAQGVSVSVSDTGQPCTVEVSVYPPSGHRHFQQQRVMRWTDGAAVSDPMGAAQGVGGYVEALTEGVYEFRVRRTASEGCGYYRIHFATSTNRGPVMPAW